MMEDMHIVENRGSGIKAMLLPFPAMPIIHIWGAVLMREKRGCRKPGIGQEGLFPEECNSCSRYSDGA
jgi:hypothetical protein